MKSTIKREQRQTSLFLAATVWAAAAFTSCHVNDDIDDTNEPVRFTAGIDQAATPAGAPTTKAAGTDWGNGDAIGIFMVEGATTHYANRKYTTAGTGSFTAAAGHEMYYLKNGNTVGFTAYYPYKDGTALDTEIDVKIAPTQTSDNQPSFDLLYSSGATGSKVTTSPVTLPFTHKLAKIVMNCTIDASVGTSLNGMTVTIKGMNTENKFDLSTGTLGNSPGDPKPITPRTVTEGSVYDAIILPGSYSTGYVTVDFTVKGETFTWDVGATSFEGGNEYSYAVTITRSKVVVTGTIKAWNTLYPDGVTAE